MASPGLYGASDGSGCCLFIRDLRSKYPNEAEQQTLFVDTKKQSNPYVYERETHWDDSGGCVHYI